MSFLRNTDPAIADLVAGEFERRRTEPTDDLISALVHAHGDDEAQGRVGVGPFAQAVDHVNADAVVLHQGVAHTHDEYNRIVLDVRHL